MVVKVLSLLSSNMVRANGNDWYELYKKVKKLREETPADEELVLDFEKVDARFEAETLYASNIVAMPNVKIILYNNADVWAALRVVALLNNKSEDDIVNKTVEIKSLTVAPPSEKELRNRKEKEYFKNKLRNIFAYQGVMRVRMNTMVSTDIPSIRSKDRGDNFRNALREIADEYELEGNPLTKIVVDTRDVDVATHVKDAIADEAGDYSIKGIKLSVISGDAEEHRKLQLRTDIGRRTLPADKKFEMLKRLGTGTVGLLTKFKKRKKDNIELRLEDTITNQYIAILRGANLAEKTVTFSCFKYTDLESKWDVFSECGETLENPPCTKKVVNIEELGLERACIGSVWHFNRFDGAADGEKVRKTNTSADGSYSEKNEEVTVPEYVRRALLSYNAKFNNDSLKRDVEQFKIDMENAAKENGRG